MIERELVAQDVLSSTDLNHEELHGARKWTGQAHPAGHVLVLPGRCLVLQEAMEEGRPHAEADCQRCTPMHNQRFLEDPFRLVERTTWLRKVPRTHPPIVAHLSDLSQRRVTERALAAACPQRSSTLSRS